MRPLSQQLRQIGLALCGLAVVLGLGWSAIEPNLQQACQWQEWPYLTRCPDPVRQTATEQVEALREQINANPGDALSYAALATFSQLPQGIPGLDSTAVLAVAGQLAPQNRFVLRLLARQWLVSKQWPEAADALVRLSMLQGDGEATKVLASMVAQSSHDPAVLAALVAQLKTDGAWLGPVVRNMPSAKLPVVQALPLVQRAMGMNLLTPELGMELVRQLIAEGVWLDAHAIWLHLWQRPLGLLFNGGFDQDFVAGGFDWDVNGSNNHRAGARVSQLGAAGRGRVLQLEFTGRPIAQPVLSQLMVLTPGQYRLSGFYKSGNLRSEGGLAWAFSCAADRRELGRSAALGISGGQWKEFDVVLKVPPDCRLGVRLSLQTFAAYESATGLRGEVQFDNLTLRTIEGPP
jgi:hypothetical protein